MFHVIQGWSAAGCFNQAFPEEAKYLLVNDDDLSCGPLLPFQSAQQWRHLRGDYWDTVAVGGEPPSDFNSDFVNALLSVDHRDSVVFWVGVGASEQLMLAFGVHLLKVGGSKAKVHVVQFTRAGARHFDVWGLGLLNPDQIVEHPPIEPLSVDAIRDLERRWLLVTSPDPTQLMAMISGAESHFAASLRTLIRRFPDARSGSSRWDYELLRFTDLKGPKATLTIGFTMTEDFGADLAGDGYLLWRLRRLGSPEARHPLVKLTGDPYSIRDCEVTLTEAGRRVLDGQANAIDLNGLDDWVLGVHLDSGSGPVWCHQNGTLVPFEPRPAP